MRATLLVLVLLAGCGEAAPKAGPDAGEKPPPKAGDLCSSNFCLNLQRVLWCDSGRYLEVPCRGPDGCILGSCDMSGNTAGDPCPSEYENTGICDAHNSKQALVCLSRVLAARPCSSDCSKVGSNIYCAP